MPVRSTVIALGERAVKSKRVRLRSPGSCGEELLWGLPEVSAVEHHGPDAVVTGSGDLLTAIVLAFDRAGLRAQDVRTETASLEDAFLALTDETDQALNGTEAQR